MQVIYEGVDIYPEISVGRCWHDMRAYGAMDSLQVDFGDVSGVWDKWSPKSGDTIEIKDGAARTGKMYIAHVTPKSSQMQVTAYPAPQSMRERRNRSWQRVRLLQLVSEIARTNGMEWASYGLENPEYAYVEQDNESDLAFLNRRLTLESAALIIFDGKLIAYSAPWMESQASNGEVEIRAGLDYTFRDDSNLAYGSCTVTDGSTTSTYTAGQGKSLNRVVQGRISNVAEASRFAKGLLREANRDAVEMTIRTDSMLRQYAAGSVLTLHADKAASWDGKAFVKAMRHDYYDSRCKLWLTKPLEGY